MDIREAAYCGNMERVQNLVEEEGLDINQRNPINGWTGTFKMQIRIIFHFAAAEFQYFMLIGIAVHKVIQFLILRPFFQQCLFGQFSTI